MPVLGQYSPRWIRLEDPEKNYAQLEKEGLALVFGVKKFYSGHPFALITDSDHRLCWDYWVSASQDGHSICRCSNIRSLSGTLQLMQRWCIVTLATCQATQETSRTSWISTPVSAEQIAEATRKFSTHGSSLRYHNTWIGLAGQPQLSAYFETDVCCGDPGS